MNKKIEFLKKIYNLQVIVKIGCSDVAQEIDIVTALEQAMLFVFEPDQNRFAKCIELINYYMAEPGKPGGIIWNAPGRRVLFFKDDCSCEGILRKWCTTHHVSIVDVIWIDKRAAGKQLDIIRHAGPILNNVRAIIPVETTAELASCLSGRWVQHQDILVKDTTGGD